MCCNSFMYNIERGTKYQELTPSEEEMSQCIFKD